MEETKQTLIYLMGAGRSGTTALSIFLNESEQAHAFGEMHQFFDHLAGTSHCACGAALHDCPFWAEIIQDLPPSTVISPLEKFQEQCRIEKHRNIPFHIILGRHFPGLRSYLSIQHSIFSSLAKTTQPLAIIDSAKYVGRALALRNLEHTNLKIIYLVRDVRGVVDSFSKNVQSPRSFFSAIFYYIMTNLAAELSRVTVFRGKVLKLRYEDMLTTPQDFFEQIHQFTGIEVQSILTRIAKDSPFSMPHMIGGNRLRQNKEIKLRTPKSAFFTMSKCKSALCYILALPFMYFNKYPLKTNSLNGGN